MEKKKREKRKDDEIRLIYDNVYDSVPGHWKWPKKKKKRKREGCFPLFLAANNLCTFLDYAESR